MDNAIERRLCRRFCVSCSAREIWRGNTSLGHGLLLRTIFGARSDKYVLR